MHTASNIRTDQEFATTIFRGSNALCDWSKVKNQIVLFKFRTLKCNLGEIFFLFYDLVTEAFRSLGEISKIACPDCKIIAILVEKKKNVPND